MRVACCLNLLSSGVPGTQPHPAFSRGFWEVRSPCLFNRPSTDGAISPALVNIFLRDYHVPGTALDSPLVSDAEEKKCVTSEVFGHVTHHHDHCFFRIR